MTPRALVPQMGERGGHLVSSAQAGPVAITMRVGRLDDLPRCAVCNRALCSHTDAEFKRGHAPQVPA